MFEEVDFIVLVGNGVFDIGVFEWLVGVFGVVIGVSCVVVDNGYFMCDK